MLDAKLPGNGCGYRGPFRKSRQFTEGFHALYCFLVVKDTDLFRLLERHNRRREDAGNVVCYGLGSSQSKSTCQFPTSLKLPMIGVKRILTDVVDFLELISPRRYESYG